MAERLTAVYASLCSRLPEWPVYKPTHRLNLHKFHDSLHGSIAYRTTPDNIPDGTTHFDLNIVGTDCFLLYIELEESLQGRGLGSALYKLIEDAARDGGCVRLRQTPSGWTYLGEPRMAYILRRGYERAGVEAIKEL
jgi:GNAT superfamily N-acetyltransferase